MYTNNKKNNELEKSLAHLLEILDDAQFGRTLRYSMTKFWAIKKWKLILFILTIAFVFGLLQPQSVEYQKTIVDRTIDLVNQSNNIVLVIFGVAFTAFTVFHATLNQNLLEFLLSSHPTKGSEIRKKYSFYEHIVLDYLSILLWSLIIITVNFLIIQFLDNRPNTWEVPFWTTQFNLKACIFLVAIYYIIFINYIYEIGSTLIEFVKFFFLSTHSRLENEKS